MYKKTNDITHSTSIMNISRTYTRSSSNDKKLLYYYEASYNVNNKRRQKKFYISRFTSESDALKKAEQWLQSQKATN